ncbi:Giant hemoglobins B chain [Lamellibrachia satsuma]|nr:Giant hemoglobins B chain [Lamellibrachia satsuma]
MPATCSKLEKTKALFCAFGEHQVVPLVRRPRTHIQRDTLATMVCLTTLFLVVICGAAATLGRQRCSREDANVTIAQWTQACGIGSNGDVTGIIKGGTHFFAKLTQDVPVTKPLFANVNIDNVNSPEFGAHVLRVFFGLDLCVNALQDIPVLEELISHLARQHLARVGVKAAYFDRISHSFRESMPLLVDNFNVDAWDNCVTPIFDAIAADLP